MQTIDFNTQAKGKLATLNQAFDDGLRGYHVARESLIAMRKVGHEKRLAGVKLATSRLCTTAMVGTAMIAGVPRVRVFLPKKQTEILL